MNAYFVLYDWKNSVKFYGFSGKNRAAPRARSGRAAGGVFPARRELL